MFRDVRFCDVTIKCNNHEAKLHRNILVPRCEIFRACCFNKFKVSEAFEQITANSNTLIGKWMTM